MGGGAGWREAGADRKKGIEGETAAANSNLQGKGGGGGRDRCGKFKSSRKGGGRGHPLIQSLRLEGALPQNNFYLGRGLAYSRRSQRADGSWNRLQFEPKLK